MPRFAVFSSSTSSALSTASSALRSCAAARVVPALAAGVLALSTGCTAPAAPTDAGHADSMDAGTADAGIVVHGAADYCEAIAPGFCAFYLRCGRMIAADMDACLTTFADSCEGRYEPRYKAYEAAGLLTLDGAGIEACVAHLEDVTCEEQVFDLAGPCGAMWQGTQPAGAACGIDIASFTCAPGNTCVLGLDFCGTCEPAAAVGAACGDAAGGLRCESGAFCADGTCIARPLAGQPCHPQAGCTLGARCVQGTCTAPTVAQEGDACDRSTRCAYRGVCLDGTCVKGVLIGEACDAVTPCATGLCTDGTCAPLKPVGASCAAHGECVSAGCGGGVCVPHVDQCISE